MGQVDHLAPASGQEPDTRDLRWLTLVKAYRAACPAPDAVASDPSEELLARVPLPAPDSRCQWGVCRLTHAAGPAGASTQPDLATP